MLVRALLCCALIAALAACRGPAPKPPAAPAGPGQAVRLPADVVPSAYRISVTPDAERMAFKGHVSIDVEVSSPVRAIVMNANELTVSRAAVDGQPAAGIALDPAAETLTLTLDRPIAAGRHVVDIDYAGKINQGAYGLFALDYDTPQGHRRMLATQFENVDARRFVPSWDEPARKASFQLTVTAPQDEMAVSNMPIAEEHPLAGGLKQVSFQATPKMSSYLLFLGLGDLERISRKVDGVDVGVVFRRGAADKARYALDRASELLGYYDRYFAIPYPLPKLDLVAAPGAAGFAAMENWGAILFFENRILVDPRLATEADRRDDAVTIAHEMAHQWFGDLVTPSWWDDVWLNESFAQWMEAKSVNDLHPDWRVWLSEAGGREAAMRLDATSATHPVVEPAETLDQVNEIPDAIVYDKGAAVVRMLEAYVGEDAWREGVRAYLRRFAYSNATHADFWKAMETASKRPVAAIAHDFTEQDGLPLVGVDIMVGQGTGSGVFLTQQRLAADAGSTGERHWRIPVMAQPAGGGARVSTLVRGGPLVTALTSPAPGPLVINPGQVGYFRTLYAPSAFAPIEARLASLEAADQLGLISDAWAFGQSGDAPAAHLMELVDQLPAGADPRVWDQVLPILSDIDSLYAGRPGQAAFRAWARRKLGAVLARAGWSARSRASDTAAVLRGDLIESLGDLGDPAVIAEARRRFAALQQGSDLPADIHTAVLRVVGRNADAASFEALARLASAAKDPAERRSYLVALAGAEDPALARRALDMSLTPAIPTTLAPVMIRRVAARHPDLAWRFALDHAAEIRPRLDPSQVLNFAPRLLSQSADADRANELRAYAEKTFPPGGRRESDKVVARILQRADVRARRLDDIDRWLKANG